MTESQATALRERLLKRIREHEGYCEFNQPVCNCRDIALLREAFTALALAEPRTDAEQCICAAIKLPNGEVWRGHRHDSAIRTASRAPYVTSDDLHAAVQGFITSRNRFVGREEGARLQREAGIISAQTGRVTDGPLFSEDLYLRDWREEPRTDARPVCECATADAPAFCPIHGEPLYRWTDAPRAETLEAPAPIDEKRREYIKRLGENTKMLTERIEQAEHLTADDYATRVTADSPPEPSVDGRYKCGRCGARVITPTASPAGRCYRCDAYNWEADAPPAPESAGSREMGRDA